LVVRSIVLIDLRASQENALLKRAQLTCRQDQHTNIKVVMTSWGTQMRCTRRQRQQLPAPAFGGREKSRGGGFPYHVGCAEREEVWIQAYEDARTNSVGLPVTIADKQRHHGFLEAFG
jgi:hypothetical protein